MNNMRKLERAELAFFTTDDIRQILSLSPKSANLFCTRATKKGLLIRIRRGLYVLPGFESSYRQEDYFKLANMIQTPSYISLLTALSYYDISTQIPISTYESICMLRSIEYSTGSTRFLYSQTKKDYYFGFTELSGYFIAEAEKALIDAAHLSAFGRYAIDLIAIDFNRLNYTKIDKYLRNYPLRTKNLITKWRTQNGTT